SPAISEEEFASDTTITINYTGRLLNGHVFDTTIKDTAKVHGIYSSSNTYGTATVSWATSADELQLTTAGSSSSSSVISGFSKTLWEMKNGEKGVGMFYSSLGYGSSGSGSSIPAYAPLIFEIEIITSTEEDE
ncbi:MAG: FKBP-type peptidyl-prolyl cis-trans isomerase, partial [Candidatus Cryptobacteroides sp.]